MKHHPDLGTQLHGVNAAVIDIFTVKADIPLDPRDGHRVVHPVQTAQKGRLATARGADEGRDCIGQDIDIDVLERMFLAIVHLHAAGGDLDVLCVHKSLRHELVVHVPFLTSAARSDDAARWPRCS